MSNRTQFEPNYLRVITYPHLLLIMLTFRELFLAFFNHSELKNGVMTTTTNEHYATVTDNKFEVKVL